jgi:hypothetical protein
MAPNLFNEAGQPPRQISMSPVLAARPSDYVRDGRLDRLLRRHSDDVVRHRRRSEAGLCVAAALGTSGGHPLHRGECGQKQYVWISLETKGEGISGRRFGHRSEPRFV